jgi:hypothetical protein
VVSCNHFDRIINNLTIFGKIHMNMTDNFFDFSDVDPIDIVETLAQHYEWDFNRVNHDHIAMLIEGTWQTYSLSLAWCEFDETFKFICSFEMNPPKESISKLHEILNLANEKCWLGSFTFSHENNLMMYRYGMNLSGGAQASAAQINSLVDNAIMICERFYPAFQLTCWGDETPLNAMTIAFEEMYGTA